MRKVAFLLSLLLMVHSLPINVFAADKETNVSGIYYGMKSSVMFVEHKNVYNMYTGIVRFWFDQAVTCPVLNIYADEDIKEGEKINVEIPNAKWYFVDAANDVTENITLLNNQEHQSLYLSLYNFMGIKGTYDMTEGEYVSDVYYKEVHNEYSYSLNTLTGELTFTSDVKKGITVKIPLVVKSALESSNFSVNDGVESSHSYYIHIKSDIDAIKSGQYLYASNYSGSNAGAPPLVKGASGESKSSDYDSVKNFIDDDKYVQFDLVGGATSREIDKDVIELLKDAKQPFKVTNGLVYASVPYQVFENASKVFVEFARLNIHEETKTALNKMNAKNDSLVNYMYKITVKVDDNEVTKLTAPLTVGFNYDALSLNESQKKNLSIMRFTNNLLSKYEFLGSKRYSNNTIDVKFQNTGNFGLALIDESAKITEVKITEEKKEESSEEAPKEEDKEETVSVYLKIGDKNYTVNTEALTADVAPEIIGNSTYVPLRFVAEALKAQVDWDENNKIAKIVLGEINLEMTLNQTIPGLDVAPVLKDDRLLVPLRYVSEQLKASVEWNPSEKSVLIIK